MRRAALEYIGRHHLALIALIVALGGTAYAANKVTSRDIQNGAVRAVDLHQGAVRGNKITNRFTVERSKVVPSGASTFISAECPKPRRTLYSGGGGWSPGGSGTTIDGIDLGASSNIGGVTVSGTNASGAAQTLTARAYCLPNH
jgi:hypothetical protein